MLLIVWDVLILPVLEDVIEVLHPLLVQQPHKAYHSSDTARNERSAREAEKEDLITFLPLLGDRTIARAHIIANRHGSRAVDEVIPEVIGRADAGLVVHDLHIAIRCVAAFVGVCRWLGLQSSTDTGHV